MFHGMETFHGATLEVHAMAASWTFVGSLSLFELNPFKELGVITEAKPATNPFGNSFLVWTIPICNYLHGAAQLFLVDNSRCLTPMMSK